MSNYPPGVTGNEWEIAGFPPCGTLGCGHGDDEHYADDNPESGCMICGCTCYTPYPEGPDPDDLYDRSKENA